MSGRFRCSIKPSETDSTGIKFEVQVKYADGWRPLFEFGPDAVAAGWEAAKRRYRSSRLRLLRNGKKVKDNRP